MTLIKTLRQRKVARPKRQGEVSPLIVPGSLLCVMTVLVWYALPNFIAFFAPAEKRIYLIVFLCLLWMLKYLMLDFDAPTARHRLEKIDFVD